MRLRTIWTIAGAAWGVVLGIIGAYAALTSFLFYTWRHSGFLAEMVPLAAILGAGPGVFFVCIALGHWMGDILERGGPEGTGLRTRIGYAAIAAAILIPAILIASIFIPVS